MSIHQCHGTTKKGTRCSIKVKDGKWCHHHGPSAARTPSPTKPLARSEARRPDPKTPLRSESPRKAVSSTSNKVRSTQNLPDYANKPGYIYVYTLASFVSKSGSSSVQTRNLVSKKDKWVSMNTADSRLLLIKVGMTTKTPTIRIQQWENKCKHTLACLYPNSHKYRSSSLADAFRRLSLKSSHKYATFDAPAQGFHVSRNVLLCEQQIHQELKSRFGRGEIHCTGCTEKTAESKTSGFMRLFSKKEQSEAEYNVHNEWFPVPKKSMDEVFRIIDSICMLYV